MRLRSSHDALAVIDIDGCWETSSGGGCSVTTGLLAGFLAPFADYPVAVMEIECGSEGSASCRFLAGNAEMMDDAYERLRAGEEWERIGAEELSGRRRPHPLRSVDSGHVVLGQISRRKLFFSVGRWGQSRLPE